MVQRVILSLVLTGGLLCPLSGVDADDEVEPDKPAPADAKLFHPPIRLAAADGVLDSGASWGHSSPWVVDVDGDGLRDLVVGDFSGLFRFHKNQGTNQAPRYATAANLKAGGVDAKVPIY
jgi:hypothetical protein